MNVASRGMRNTFRNITRTLSIVIILGLSIGLSLVMLIAHQTVQNKIKTTLSSIGNTINISPTGFTAGSEANNALTTAQLAKVAKLPHVTNLTEALTDQLQTIGTSLPAAGAGGESAGGGQNNSAKTSLKSPAKLNSGGSGPIISGSTKLPSNFSLPVPIVGSNHPTDPSNILATSFKIVSGKAISGTKDTNDAMLSSSMAKKNNLKVSSTFTAYGKTLTVAAIFNSNTDAGNANIIVSLPTEQQLSGNKGDVSSAVAMAGSLTNLSSTTSAVKNSLGPSADVTSNLTQANDALAPLNSVKNVSLYSLVGSVIAGAVIILLTMIMIVRERKREIGVLKAIGFSNVRIMLQFMCEALTFTVLGTVIGLALGLVGGNPVTSTLVENGSNAASNANTPSRGGGMTAHNGGSTGFQGNPKLAGLGSVHAQIGYTIILDGIAAAILIALIGSALASYFISKVRPAEVLRSE
jgi:putative ABC transport system permease protein